ERAVFNLADGSRVMLGAESRLRIPAAYNTVAGGGRHLFLEGEAYFEVQHDSTRPFLVETPTGIAEDLGTEFVVTAYPETQGMRVVVKTGIVALRGLVPAQSGGAGLVDTAALLTLEAGDVARLDTSGVARLNRGVDIRRHLAWTEGTVLFDGTQLDEAVLQLGRWYDLDIRLADPSLGALPLTATFRNEPAPQMLRLLELALDVRVEQDGRHVILSSKKSGRRRSE
ncbi:MAG: FecR family protein, partial [bacterium]